MERLMKRYLALAACLLALAACGPKQPHLVILHLNDTHSHFEPLRMGDQAGQGGVIERAAYIDSVRRAEGKNNVLLLHAGDFSQGSSYFTKLGGDLEIETINALGYDCVTLGNHEFDNGIEDLGRRLAMLKCPVVCCNYDFSPFEAGKYIKPYTILNRGGYKIGIFGLLCDISRMVDRTIADRIPHLDDVAEANRWADYLKNEEKCDLVIALTHIGYEDEPFTDPMMVPQVRNIDLVVGGHSHSFLDEMESATDPDGREVPIVQDGCWGLYIGKIEVDG